MKHITVAAVVSAAVLIVACTGGGGTTGSSSGASSGTASGIGPGQQTAPDTQRAPSSPAPTGKACSSANDCANWYCRCNDGAVVNSRLCYNGSCQAPSAHCEDACKVFDHGGWSGTAGGGDDTSPGTSSGTPSDPPSAGGCTKKEDCAPFECGCTDGSRISVRDCLGGECNDAFGGCQSACSDSGRGDWDGT